MHVKRYLALALVSGPALLLAACSNSGSAQLPSTASPLGLTTQFVSMDDRAPAMPARSARNLVFVDPMTLKAQMFVAAYNPSGETPVDDYNANDSKNQKSICQITSVGEGINAIGVSAADELWIPQGLDPKSGVPDIVSYAPNCGAKGATLTDSKGQPAGIAFAPDGTRYVNNILGPSSSAGNVAVYPSGKQKPTRFLTNSEIFFANGVGADSKGNVYVSFYTATSATGVMKFTGGQMPGKVLGKIKNGAPGAIAFDKNDNLIITDDSAVTLNVYAPPYDKAPKTYPLEGHSPQCSLNKAQTNLACSDKTNTSVDVFSYPAGKYLYSFNNGLTATVIGIAQDPP
jgi:hypothetical protein